MYCKRCRTAIPDNEVICPRCSYDNSNNNLGLDYYANNDTNNNTFARHKIATFLISCILITIGVIMLFSTFSKAKIEDDTEPKIIYSTFTIDNLSFQVPSNFGTSTNTIFYKTNSDININIKEITEDIFKDTLKKKEYIEVIINDIKMNKLDDSYLLKLDDKYYEIKINYIDDNKIYTDEVKKEIDTIINSIQKDAK